MLKRWGWEWRTQAIIKRQIITWKKYLEWWTHSAAIIHLDYWRLNGTLVMWCVTFLIIISSINWPGLWLDLRKIMAPFETHFQNNPKLRGTLKRQSVKSGTDRCSFSLGVTLRCPRSAFVLPTLLQQFLLLFLPVLDIDESWDETVLHLFLKVQLVPPCQLLHQLLWEPPDVGLCGLQTFVQLCHTQTPDPCTRYTKTSWSNSDLLDVRKLV